MTNVLNASERIDNSLIMISTETDNRSSATNLSIMPLATRFSSSKHSADSGGDGPGEIARSLLRPRSSNSAAVLPGAGVSIGQRDVFTFTSSNDETTKTTPRRSNKSRKSAMSSSDEAANEMMMVPSAKKRRKISDVASTVTTTSRSNKDPPPLSPNGSTTTSQPGPNDVMYGRGGETNAHIGNQKYRYIVESLKSKYSLAPRFEKSSIAMDIVSLWRKLDPPGRFLKSSRGEDERDGQNDGGPSWYDVGENEAKKKTSQALRDAANSSAANYIKHFERDDAELLQACVEYLQDKTPGSGEVVDPLVLLDQMKSRKVTQQKQKIPPSGVCSPRTYPVQSVRGAVKLSPSSTAYQHPSELEAQPQRQLSMSFSPNNRDASTPQLEQNPPKRQQRLTPTVVGEIFASLGSNKGCKHDFSIIILPDVETTIMPPFLQYSEGTYLFLRPNLRIPPVLSNRKLTEHDLSSMSECRWTMTGPNSANEYPARYMTPKTGSLGYNKETRGILYSRKDENGNDDIDAKILHVYRSEKVTRPGPGQQSVALPQDAPTAKAKVVDSHVFKKKDKRLSKQKKVKFALPDNDSILEAVPETKKHFRHAWSDAEDCELRQLVEGYTSLNQRIRWVEVSKNIPGRSGKQCRERWMYQVQPGLKREDFTPEEDALLDSLVETMGTKWTQIQKKMPGRSDMDVKNRWHYRERARKRRERNDKLNDQLPIIQTDNAAGAGGQQNSAGTDALTSLCDVALAKEQEDIERRRRMECGETSTEGSAWSESPEVGMKVRVRFEDEEDDGGFVFYGGTITNISSELQELKDMAAAMDIDGLANAVANGANQSPLDQSQIGSIVAPVSHKSKITITYDDGSTEECDFPDPDIQLVTSNLSEEEMSLSNELLNLNVSLSLGAIHARKRNHGGTEASPAESEIKNNIRSDCVPLETVRGLLLGDLDPIELAMRLLPSDDVMLVKKKWRKSA